MKLILLGAIMVFALAGVGTGRVLANAGERTNWVAPQTAGGAVVVGGSPRTTIAAIPTPSVTVPAEKRTPSIDPPDASSTPQPAPFATPVTERIVTQTAPVVASPNPPSKSPPLEPVPPQDQKDPPSLTKTATPSPKSKPPLTPLADAKAEATASCIKTLNPSVGDEARCSPAEARK